MNRAALVTFVGALGAEAGLVLALPLAGLAWRDVLEVWFAVEVLPAVGVGWLLPPRGARRELEPGRV